MTMAFVSAVRRKGQHGLAPEVGIGRASNLRTLVARCIAGGQSGARRRERGLSTELESWIRARVGDSAEGTNAGTFRT